MANPELIIALSSLAVSVHLGLRLRRNAQLHRRQLTCEHVVAEHSIRLINCPPAKTGGLIAAMLAELASSMGMQRAYLVLDDDPSAAILWQADGLAFPPGWPAAAPGLPLRPDSAHDPVLAIEDTTLLDDPQSSSMLLDAGARSWIGIDLARPGLRGIIGFDGQQPIATRDQPCRQMLRMVGSVVANALERERLERDRAKLVEGMERSRRVQTIGVLASGIAHNFNNVISSIRGYTEMAADDAGQGTRLARYLSEIRRAADSGRDLIEGILAFGNESKGARPVRVTDLLAEAGSLLCAALPSSMEIAMADIGPGVCVFGDPVQLQQVIINLCTNASQAMDSRGSVRVSAEVVVLTTPLALTDGELPPGRYVRLGVRDTGCGFDATVAARLFEPFFTTKRAGTGLGLATVREIVRDHDGAIQVESAPGHGSTFEVWLPAELDEAWTARARAAVTDQCSTGSPNWAEAASDSSQ